MNVPRDLAIAATDARVREPQRVPASFGVSTDTRTLRSGEAFVALRGDRYDGHRYIAEALERGAALLVVDEEEAAPAGVAAFLVNDTREAYLALGGVARSRSHARIVAITGSTGKTTTKDFAAQLLAGEDSLHVAATFGNENNEIGVAKLLLGLSEDVDVAIVEFGARHYGEIEPLARAARPDVAVLTNIGDAHLQIVGSPERLAETKWGIFAGDAQPVINARDERSRARVPSLKRAPHSFCAIDAGAAIEPFGVRSTVMRGRDELVIFDGDSAQTLAVRCNVPGEHNRANVAAACAAVFALGFEPSAIAPRIAGLELPSGRYERRRVRNFEIIFDAYNASPAGTLATLDAFAREQTGRRIAVLSSMAELGTDSPALHARVGAAAARAGLAALLVGGDYAADLARGAEQAGFASERLVQFEQNGQAARWLLEHAHAGDLVLLKGSRRYKLEEIAEELAANGG